MPRPPILTVVDYDAWDKGYMPPSEHILIDKLAYRGARVAFASWLGGDAHVWLVLEGAKPLTRKQRKAVREFVALFMDDEPDEAPKPDDTRERSEAGLPHPSLTPPSLNEEDT